MKCVNCGDHLSEVVHKTLIEVSYQLGAASFSALNAEQFSDIYRLSYVDWQAFYVLIR